jgi:hypothetical protein
MFSMNSPEQPSNTGWMLFFLVAQVSLLLTYRVWHPWLEALNCQSRARLAGIPLVHVHFSTETERPACRSTNSIAPFWKPVAKGWPAIGEASFGVASIGVFSVGILSFGGFTAGILAIGIFAAGALRGAGRVTISRQGVRRAGHWKNSGTCRAGSGSPAGELRP